VRGPNRPAELDAHQGIQDKRLQVLQNKADISRHEYERSLHKLNLSIDALDTSFRPILNKVQENDDSQISFVKYNLEKFARYIDQTGKDLRLNADEISQTVQIISSDTDIRIFVDTHKSMNQFPLKEDFQPYEQKPRVDLISRKSEEKGPMIVIDENYMGQIRSASSSTGATSASSDSCDFELISSKDPLQADRQLVSDQLHKLLKSQPISIEEKGMLIQGMHNKVQRQVVTEVLHEINTLKPLSNLDCLKQIADVFKFILTLFVHEQSSDYKLLYSILDSSHHIFYLSDRKRKQFLYTLLEEHGIWHGNDGRTWRECILEVVQIKMQDVQKRKLRKLAAGGGGGGGATGT
jgi:hypothetical protein